MYPQVEWGIDLSTEHERYICEEIFKMPTIVYNYPREIKAFYMKLNEDGKTVAAMDVLVPKVRTSPVHTETWAPVHLGLIFV